MIYCKRRLLLLLEINLWNGLTADSLCIQKSLCCCMIQVVIRNLSISFQNISELVPYVLVVRNIFVSEFFEVIENVLNLWAVFCSNPKFFLRIIQAFSLYILDLLHWILFLFSPFKFFIEKVQDHKIKTPQVISSWEVL